MKKHFLFLVFLIIATLFISEAKAQFKVHSNGQVSFQSTTTTQGIQIFSNGRSSFEPNITTSSTNLTQTKVLTQQVKAWNVRYAGNSTLIPYDRFYVTGVGDAYAHNHYTISSNGGGNSKESYPIENATRLLSNLSGYYYHNHDFDGFEPDYINNPNILPEAVEGMTKDLEIDKTLGLSVEDLQSVLPEAIRHDPEGMVYINYSAVIPVLVEAFKEQQYTIENLQKEIADLKADDKGFNGIENGEISRNALFQNTPNPTNYSTNIECLLDSYFSNAFIAIYDLNGQQIKEYPVYHQGKNTITIEANEFKPGIYLYSLLVDGKLIDTKRMVITSK